MGPTRKSEMDNSPSDGYNWLRILGAPYRADRHALASAGGGADGVPSIKLCLYSIGETMWDGLLS